MDPLTQELAATEMAVAKQQLEEATKLLARAKTELEFRATMIEDLRAQAELDRAQAAEAVKKLQIIYGLVSAWRSKSWLARVLLASDFFGYILSTFAGERFTVQTGKVLRVLD